MDSELFELAVQAAMRIPTSGIGTLAEKRIHAALKYYVQPDKALHEARRLGFVIDALSSDGGVFEIQTRAFNRLSKKSEALLKLGTFTVVYPIIAEKILYITDIDTGEVTVRKSPRHASAYDVFNELYKIRKYILSENFRLRIITLGAEEYRTVRRSRSKKGRLCTEKLTSETVPTELYDDITLSSGSDYSRFLPSGLPSVFTSADFAASCKIKRSTAATALLLLTELKLAERIGKKGNAYLYRSLSDSFCGDRQEPF